VQPVDASKLGTERDFSSTTVILISASIERHPLASCTEQPFSMIEEQVAVPRTELCKHHRGHQRLAEERPALWRRRGWPADLPMGERDAAALRKGCAVGVVAHERAAPWEPPPQRRVVRRPAKLAAGPQPHMDLDDAARARAKQAALAHVCGKRGNKVAADLWRRAPAQGHGVCARAERLEAAVPLDVLTEGARFGGGVAEPRRQRDVRVVARPRPARVEAHDRGGAQPQAAGQLHYSGHATELVVARSRLAQPVPDVERDACDADSGEHAQAPQKHRRHLLGKQPIVIERVEWEHHTYWHAISPWSLLPRIHLSCARYCDLND